jgi:DNA-binding LytR/AlgR family response regulator
MKIFKICIIEDEFPARELLIKYISSNKNLKLSGYADNGIDAISILKNSDYDIIIMDIDLPNINGIEVSKYLKENTNLIFATALKEHAVTAFELGALDYLLKPYSEERFNQAIERAISQSKNKETQTQNEVTGISITEKNNHYLIPYTEIIYLSSHGKHTVVHTITKDYEINKLMKELELKLINSIFKRIHKQTIVNVTYISHIQYYQGGAYIAFLKDEDETQLSVGRSFASSLKQFLNIK